MVNILNMSEGDVEKYVAGQCAEKSVTDLMGWIDVLKGDNNPEMNLSVAKLQCGLEISKGEYTRLEEGRPKFIEAFKDRLERIKTPQKKYNMKTQKLEDVTKITYILNPDESEGFVLPDVTESMALRYCKLSEEDATILASAEKLAEQSESKKDTQALIELQEILSAKYMVARNLFVTRTLMAEEVDSKKVLKLKKAEAARNLKRWKISAIQAEIQARTTAETTLRADDAATSWMSEEGLKAIAEE